MNNFSAHTRTHLMSQNMFEKISHKNFNICEIFFFFWFKRNFAIEHELKLCHIYNQFDENQQIHTYTHHWMNDDCQLNRI